MATNEGIRSTLSHATVRTFPEAAYLRKPVPALEREWRDPDDVYLDVERREEVCKKQGLPPRVGFVPHSAVAEEEARWEAQQERKKKRARKRRKPTSNAKSAGREKAMTKKRVTKKPKVVWVGSTPITPITAEERKEHSQAHQAAPGAASQNVFRSPRQGRGLHHPNHR